MGASAKCSEARGHLLGIQTTLRRGASHHWYGIIGRRRHIHRAYEPFDQLYARRPIEPGSIVNILRQPKLSDHKVADSRHVSFYDISHEACEIAHESHVVPQDGRRLMQGEAYAEIDSR